MIGPAESDLIGLKTHAGRADTEHHGTSDFRGACLSWSNDPELQRMFVDEVAERSARLVDGARAFREGTITPHEAGELVREGHTIKGTARVMGYDDVGSAGLMLETIWRWIQRGEIAPPPIFGRMLEALSAAIPRALDHPSELIEAMTGVREFLEGQDLPEALPEIPAASAAEDQQASVHSPASPTVEKPLISSTPTPATSLEPSVEETFGASGDSASGIGEGVDEPMSAREAFAALRAEMTAERHAPTIEEAASGVHAPDGERGFDLPTFDRPVARSSQSTVASSEPRVANANTDGGEPPADGEWTETLSEETKSGPDHVEQVPATDGGVPDAVGDAVTHAAVIEFPLSAPVDDEPETDGEAASSLENVEERAGEDRSEVVVLPSSNRHEQPITVDGSDLGGLVGQIQSWVSEESVSVAAGRLYGLVDHIVSLRMNLASMQEQLNELSEIAAADPFFSERVSSLAGELGPIAEASEGIEARALSLASVPLSNITDTLPQLVKYLGRKTGRELRVELVGDDVLVDKQVLGKLGDAIRQLVVNSAVHGIEDLDARIGAGKSGTGTIRVEADQTDVNLRVSVVDDGRGIPWGDIRQKGLADGLLEGDTELSPEALRSLLYRPGFSTLASSDELAGDGEGLADVRQIIDTMNGTMSIESTPRAGTSVTISVPVHHAMQKALLVVAGGFKWGIPETGVGEILEMNTATIAVSDAETVLEHPDGNIPFTAFAEVMGLATVTVPKSIVVVTGAGGRVALGVEDVVGMRRVAAKELGSILAGADAVTGAALLGGDDVVLLVDTTRIAERQREAANENPVRTTATVLIVDDSKGVQQVVSSALATSGFRTSVASNVAEALGVLQMQPFDAVVVDFSMPRADGVALAHMVRQRHGDLPIVMLSGVADGEDIERAREAGVDAFFSKGDLSEGGLAVKLRALITVHRSKEQTA